MKILKSKHLSNQSFFCYYSISAMQDVHIFSLTSVVLSEPPITCYIFCMLIKMENRNLVFLVKLQDFNQEQPKPSADFLFKLL